MEFKKIVKGGELVVLESKNVIDLRDETLGYISSEVLKNERIHVLHFDNYSIVLNDEQMESIIE